MPPNPFRADGTYPPLLSDFSYDNLGIPKSTNPLIAGNPVDYGLGDASRVAELATLNPVVVDYEDGPATFEKGKFKVSSLRNLAKTAPYAHNGYFATMKEIVHFYNTRDALPKCEELGITAVEGVNCWPTSEVPDTVNGDELGNLGLSGAQEDKSKVFTSFYGKLKTAPLAKECPVNIECRLFTSVDCGSHLLYIGEVVEIHADKACVADGKPDTVKSDPIVYAQSAYWHVGKQIDKAFSAGKKYQKE
jgi:hypothetical protein